MKHINLLAIAALVVLGACSQAPSPTGYADPHEEQNRRTHRANITLDKALISPASDVYGQVPKPARVAVTNFSDNAGLPGVVVNKFLQGKVDDAVHNSVRFLFNSTLGLLGLFDVASDIGLEERNSDFGETLHVWGAPEGDYVVLPFFGASTERDGIGILVDFVLNPLGYALPTEVRHLPKAAWVVSKFGDRYDFADSVDSILYSDGDGYSTLQLYYLDSRRYELGQVVEDDELDDLYEAYDG
ncbi:VacJ family lipoprotein [Aliiroseovarius sp. KMU-50]|uniref:VacJ family lipoprotein n=1 Tax=Aliiroseovarius salicola TaxID=3009082 RepID=A0ABT4VWK5_9RHOB|nr:VacJ family lipoprotein [Aliiroseovarius sp. KMU-50]MDA5092625.1 VacJ family lipoprotein [Aliiroseovarius sp. KMU-50]